jgi:hypothetical protein
MSVPNRLAALLLAIALVGGACDSGRRSPGPELLDEVDVEPELTVEIDDAGFEPTTLSIEEGEAFEVRNTGEESHGFLIDDPYVDTGLLLPGESSVIVLTTPGAVEATDSENPDAMLTIEVGPER